MSNKYPLSLRDWWRYRLLGNRLAWQRTRHELLKPVAATLVIFLGYGLVGRLDYEAELATVAEAQRTRAETAEQFALDCLNGRARWITDDGHTLIACEKAWETAL